MIARRIFVRGVLGILTGVGVMAVVACGSRDTVRYKMTVEVETPQGMKSGFAVREVTHSTPPPIPMLGESRPQWNVKGEAVVVDLGGGQALFALLTGSGGESDYGARIYGRTFETASYPGNSHAPIVRGKSAILWPKAPSTYGLVNTDPLPMLVRFRDISDPNTVEAVKPYALDKAFGAGVRLKQITVEKTTEPVTVGIGERLGWLQKHYDGMLNSDEIEWIKKTELSAHLASGSFSTFRQGSAK